MAATVPSKGVLLWPGTHAALEALANWSRLSDYDGRYAQGSTISGFSETNGGSASHGHTVSGTHAHAGDLHTHTFNAGDHTAATSSLSTSVADVTIGEGAHGHVNATSASTTLTYSSESITINDATDQDPKFAVLIFMEPDDGLQDIPDDTVCFADSASLPTGFSKANGSGTTAPDLNGRFIKSAAAGVDGGATGGSDTHPHTSPSHPLTSSGGHTHAATRCGGLTIDTVTNDVEELGGRAAVQVLLGDHHDVTMVSAVVGSINNTAVTVEAASSEPAFVKLMAIENTSGAATTPDGVVIGFRGTTVPSGWALCDGTAGTPNCTNLQIKCTTADGEIEDTGGADSQSHNITDHKHTHASSHTHTTSGNDTNTLGVASGVDVNGLNSVFTHFGEHSWSVASTTPTMQNATGIVTSSDDVRQPYRTMLFIKKSAPPTSKNFMAGTLWGPTNALAG